MTINGEEIKKLRRELERDIEALARVENLLAKRSMAGGHPSSANNGTEPTGLTPQVLDAVRSAGPNGVRANDVVKLLMERGYPFADKGKGASSVATTLRRLVKKKQLEKEGMIYKAKAEQ